MTNTNELLLGLEQKLQKASLMDLRQVARALGVKRPAEGKKERIISEILAIARGETDPSASSKRGAPPKSAAYDRELYAAATELRQMYVRNECCVSDVSSERQEKYGVGILCKTGGAYTLRDCADCVVSGLVVPERLINIYSLRCGDRIQVEYSTENGAQITDVVSVNGEPFSDAVERGDFISYTRIYPEDTLRLGTPDSVIFRQADYLCPVLAGQRVFCFAESEKLKHPLLCELLRGLIHNNRSLSIAVAGICCRPETRLKLQSEFPDVQFFFADFDKSRQQQLLNLEIATEYAKRQVEYGKNTVLVLDGAFHIAKSYEIVDFEGANRLKETLAFAGKMAEGASLTVVAVSAALSSSATDMALFNEFSSCCNANLFAVETEDNFGIDPERSTVDGGNLPSQGARRRAVKKLVSLTADELYREFCGAESEESLDEKFGG